MWRSVSRLLDHGQLTPSPVSPGWCWSGGGGGQRRRPAGYLMSAVRAAVTWLGVCPGDPAVCRVQTGRSGPTPVPPSAQPSRSGSLTRPGMTSAPRQPSPARGDVRLGAHPRRCRLIAPFSGGGGGGAAVAVFAGAGRAASRGGGGGGGGAARCGRSWPVDGGQCRQTGPVPHCRRQTGRERRAGQAAPQLGAAGRAARSVAAGRAPRRLCATAADSARQLSVRLTCRAPVI